VCVAEVATLLIDSFFSQSLNDNIIIFQLLKDVNVVVMDVWWCCEAKTYLEQLSEHLIAHGHVGGCMYSCSHDLGFPNFPALSIFDLVKILQLDPSKVIDKGGHVDHLNPGSGGRKCDIEQ
jgi:hypothetical protein